MSLYDKELLDKLTKNNWGIVDKNPADYYFDILNEKFPIYGTQIDWIKSGIFYKKLEPERIILDFNECILYLKNNFLKKMEKEKIIYIGDSLTENAYEFLFGNINHIWNLVMEIPHHHYFIHPTDNWCISVNMTDDFNFGYPPNY